MFICDYYVNLIWEGGWYRVDLNFKTNNRIPSLVFNEKTGWGIRLIFIKKNKGGFFY